MKPEHQKIIDTIQGKDSISPGEKRLLQAIKEIGTIDPSEQTQLDTLFNLYQQSQLFGTEEHLIKLLTDLGLGELKADVEVTVPQKQEQKPKVVTPPKTNIEGQKTTKPVVEEPKKEEVVVPPKKQKPRIEDDKKTVAPKTGGNDNTEPVVKPVAEEEKIVDDPITIEKPEKPVSFGNIEGLTEEMVNNATKSLNSAINRLQRNRKFRRKGYRKKVLFQKYFPLMIKESVLNPKAKSKSGAYGYFQLKAAATSDAKDYLRNRLGVRKNYDVKKPVDNCIMGIVYFEKMEENVRKISDDISNDSVHEFTLFSYNAGYTTLKGILEHYAQEKPTPVSWQDFSLWLAMKTGASGKTNKKLDGVYRVEFTDLFDGKDFQGDTKIVLSQENGDQIITIEKIYESINYVEKILAIGEVDIRKQIPRETLPTRSDDIIVEKATKDESISSFLSSYGLTSGLAMGVFQDLNATKGSSVKKDQNYKLPIINHEIKGKQNLRSVLKTYGLNRRYANILFKYNKSYNKDFNSIPDITSVPKGTKIYIPLWSTGFYTGGEEVDIKPSDDTSKKVKPKVATLPTGVETNDKRKSFDYKSWIKSIEVVSEDFKGYTFVIDPGHGSIDGGSSPTVIDGNKKKVRLSEAAVVYDISLRLALKLKQAGASVVLTHYSDARGITNKKNIWKVPEGSNIYYDTGKTWAPSKKMAKNLGKNAVAHNAGRTIRHRVDIGNTIYEGLSTKEKKKSFFLSIHADMQLSTRENLPVTIVYHNSRRTGTNKTGREFARLFAKNIHFRGQRGKSKGQPLGIVNTRNSIPNSVLIETANMNNSGAAWLLRTSEGRSRFTESLYTGLLASRKQ